MQVRNIYLLHYCILERERNEKETVKSYLCTTILFNLLPCIGNVKCYCLAIHVCMFKFHTCMYHKLPSLYWTTVWGSVHNVISPLTLTVTKLEKSTFWNVVGLVPVYKYNKFVCMFQTNLLTDFQIAIIEST